MELNINILINQEKKDFDVFYRKLLTSILPKNELSKSMIYGSMNGGKRIRPFIISIFAKLVNIKKNNYRRLAAAVESIHSYSLIHDDLPSMDNDDYRRGKLSVHKKFNEAIAILAGDALHDLAFEIISNHKIHKDSRVRISLIENLSVILGAKGLAGGQSLDLLFENKKVNKKKIFEMYSMKTSALFSFCCSAPFILAKRKKDEIKFSKEFGKIYGLIFQIVDDIIDETQSFKILGKTPGKDKKQGKSNLVSYTNKKESILFCTKMGKNFINKNKKFFNRWPILEKILFFNLKRVK